MLEESMILYWLVYVIWLAAVLAGLVNRRRSILLAVVALLFALQAGSGALDSWAHSNSTWNTLRTANMLRLGVEFVISVVAFVRQFVIGNERKSTIVS
jgi:hypothetical protein